LKLKNFLQTWEATKTANLILLAAVLILALLNAYLVTSISRVKIQRELIPPMLTQSAKVGYASADDAYYKAWGLYVAELVGNLTPGNAEFVAESLGRLFSSDDAAQVHSKIITQGQELQKNGVVMFFKANQITYEPETGEIYVTGDQREVSPNGASVSSEQMTYQMHVKIIAGQPVLTKLSTYTGPAHTEAWKANHASQPAAPAPASSSSGEQP
jgi:conjugal transfer pilus assembly protein TraE